MGVGEKGKEDVQIQKGIVDSLRGSQNEGSMNVKQLRKQVLMIVYRFSESEAESADKPLKKLFKKQIQHMESNHKLTLDADGTVTLSKEELKQKSKKRKKDKDKESTTDTKDSKKQKKSKKQKHKEEADETTDDVTGNDENNDKKDGDENENQEEQEAESARTSQNDTKDDGDKNAPCSGNPMGCTRLFVGNLPFAVNEESLGEHFSQDGSNITHIKWITDKEDGHFYGSAFVEIHNSREAAIAVSKIKGKKLMGRPLKIDFAPARPGDVWPPEDKVVTGNQQSASKKSMKPAGGVGTRAMSEKPEGCTKLFVGNLSYEIDDDTIYKFFASVDAEMKAVRWIHHKDTNDFKGVGFVEFWNTEACDKAATLNGKPLLGRPIRIDWTD